MRSDLSQGARCSRCGRAAGLLHGLCPDRLSAADLPRPSQCGKPSCRVSRPKIIANIERPAKQVIIAVALLKSPPNGATSKPATSGPKLVITRPEPLQNE